MFTLTIKNTIIDCTLLLKQRKTCCYKMPYMTSSQSVTDGISISLSVSQNWYIAVWYFVDNKLTLICLFSRSDAGTEPTTNRRGPSCRLPVTEKRRLAAERH